jgi:hypothetical protein
MTDTPPTSGISRRHLLSGPHAERLVMIEVEDSEIVAVLDMESGDELPVSCVGREDYDYVIDDLKQRNSI